MPRILVATRDGLHAVGTDEPVQHAGRSVTAIVRDGPQLWAILDRAEIWHAPQAEWRLVATLDGFAATCLAMTDVLTVGSAEAHLFRLGDSGLERVEAFDAADGRDEWYTPWSGPPDTRSFSEWDDDVFVNVHVGGILRTSDRGASWTPTIDIDADVHQVATAEGLVLAACAGGLATSNDRGGSWTLRDEGLDAPYSRGVAVCGETVLVSASRGPRGGDAAIYRGDLAGGGFERCPTTPERFDDNIDSYCLDALNDGTYAAFGTTHGAVYGSDDAGASWAELASGLLPIQHLLVAP
jgi:hypothetical protein